MLTTSQTADTNTQSLAQPGAVHDVPVEPLISINQNKDKMNGTNSNFTHMQKIFFLNIYIHMHIHTKETQIKGPPQSQVNKN